MEYGHIIKGFCTGCNHRPCTCAKPVAKEVFARMTTIPKQDITIETRMAKLEAMLEKLLPKEKVTIDDYQESQVTNPGITPPKVIVDLNPTQDPEDLRTTMRCLPKVVMDAMPLPPPVLKSLSWDEPLSGDFLELDDEFDVPLKKDESEEEMNKLRTEIDVMEGVVRAARAIRNNLSATPGVRAVPSRNDIMELLIALDNLDLYRNGL